jgi:16S rRNA (cytidine1402-2'-O)-methyltransferase
MDGRAEALEPGLYFVATPIGAARDITLRALDILRSAEVLAAEDTRTLRHLMDIHGIALSGREMVAYHDHNGAAALPRLMAALAAGKAVAYASEAGTPLVADPGFALGREAAAAGHAVRAAPGASAVLAALTVSGLPTDRFLFAGFPPAKGAARRDWLAELAHQTATLVIYESPHRIGETLGDLRLTFGGERRAALCRELTKRFEDVIRDTLDGICDRVAATPPRGEIVLVIDRAPPRAATAPDIRAALSEALRTLSVKDAAQAVAEATGMPRRDVYQIALGLVPGAGKDPQ